MNIFYLDRDPKIAAQLACDKHVVKMILESAQMLCTAHRVLDGDDYADRYGLYKMVQQELMQYPHPQRINYRLITKLFAELDQMQDKELKKEIIKKYLAKPNTSKPNHAVLGYVVDDTKKTVETLLKESLTKNN